jgi:hypothetical protein
MKNKIQKLADIWREAEDRGMSLDLPAPFRINYKLIEHALCEFSKYIRQGYILYISVFDL